MQLADLKDDGDYKLVITDQEQKFKIYQGTTVLFDTKLEEKPTALEIYYDSSKKPMLPIIAIACSHTIYFYKMTTPFLKFQLPVVEFSEEEKKLWQEMAGEPESFGRGCEELYKLREKGTVLSSLSVELLSLET